MQTMESISVSSTVVQMGYGSHVLGRDPFSPCFPLHGLNLVSEAPFAFTNLIAPRVMEWVDCVLATASSSRYPYLIYAAAALQEITRCHLKASFTHIDGKIGKMVLLQEGLGAATGWDDSNERRGPASAAFSPVVVSEGHRQRQGDRLSFKSNAEITIYIVRPLATPRHKPL